MSSADKSKSTETNTVQPSEVSSPTDPTQPSRVQKSADTEKSPTVLKPTALVTDDNFFNRDIFKVALEDAGFETAEAENGKSCLAVLDNQKFDLLILDLQMPDINGLDIMRQLKAKNGERTMRILVVTANPHMITPDVEDMADFVMQKPVNVTDFSNFAKRMVAQRVDS